MSSLQTHPQWLSLVNNFTNEGLPTCKKNKQANYYKNYVIQIKNTVVVISSHPHSLNFEIACGDLSHLSCQRETLKQRLDRINTLLANHLPHTAAYFFLDDAQKLWMHHNIAINTPPLRYSPKQMSKFLLTLIKQSEAWGGYFSQTP